MSENLCHIGTGLHCHKGRKLWNAHKIMHWLLRARATRRAR